MSVIRQDDLISSVADALQFISYYHPIDFIEAVNDISQPIGANVYCADILGKPRRAGADLKG